MLPSQIDGEELLWTNHRTEHWTLLHWGQCMTCHTLVRRLTAALHNAQGHSHHKPYVSETGNSLCLWRGVTDIYHCGQQCRALIHKLNVVHIINIAEALLGRLMNYVVLLSSTPERSTLCFCLHSDALQSLTKDRCFRQDVMVLSFIYGSIWPV